MIVDFLNREFKVGDKVVYPGRTGSMLWMNYGIVQSIGLNHLKVKLLKSGAIDMHSKSVVVVRTDRVVII